MFTGIISETTHVRMGASDEKGMLLTFDRPKAWDDLKLGESIATNGVCLTITDIRDDDYDCFVIPETLQRTTFSRHVPEVVNLERALRLSDRLDGSIVQGHVDEMGRVSATDDDDGRRLTIAYNPANHDLIVYKGSITIDGVALTLTSVAEKTFQVAIIPYTLKHTTLSSLKVGDEVNLEFDVIGKYVSRIVSKHET